MQRMNQKEAVTIVGVELRTNNNEATQTVPAFWKKFYEENLLTQLTDKESVDLYAVYTNYADAGYSSEGQYSLIIGVTADEFTKDSEGLAQAVLPQQEYIVFSVNDNKEENVDKTWQAILKNKIIERTFDVDYECYRSNGYIDVVVGVR